MLTQIRKPTLTRGRYAYHIFRAVIVVVYLYIRLAQSPPQ